MMPNCGIAYVCRVCGTKNIENKCIFDKDHGDLLDRLQTTFSTIVSSKKQKKKLLIWCDHLEFIMCCC